MAYDASDKKPLMSGAILAKHCGIQFINVLYHTVGQHPQGPDSSLLW
jgi:hypothetical protein